MLNRKLRLGILVLIAVVGMVLAGCSDDSGPSYDVWVGSWTYSDYEEVFKDRSDMELGDREWISTKFTSKATQAIYNQFRLSKRNLTEDEIKEWFLDRGFDDTMSEKAKSYLIEENDPGWAIIFARNGSTVNVIAN